MNTELQLPDGTRVTVTVERKPVKRLRLVVYADGRLRLAVPWACPEADWRRFLNEQAQWLSKRLAHRTARPQQDLPRYQTGQLVRVKGQDCVLHRELPEDDYCQVFLEPERGLILRVPEHYTDEHCEATLYLWYKQLVEIRAKTLFDLWEPRMGVHALRWSVRRMSTRWGSCSTGTRTIRLNSELAKYPPECLEYVIVHELAHLSEANHSPRFWSIVERHLPHYKTPAAMLKGKSID